jgi:hypothetical protein
MIAEILIVPDCIICFSAPGAILKKTDTCRKNHAVKLRIPSSKISPVFSIGKLPFQSTVGSKTVEKIII